MKDQKGERKYTLGAKDRNYEKRRLKRREKEPIASNICDEDVSCFELSESGSASANSSFSDDYAIQPGTSAKPKANATEPENPTKSIVLGPNFVKDLALTGTARQVSSRDLVHLGVDLVTQAGGEISNFKISEPTIRRAKKRAS